MIGDNIVVMVVSVHGEKVQLGIEAPREIPVHRFEVAQAIKRDGQRKEMRDGKEESK